MSAGVGVSRRRSVSNKQQGATSSTMEQVIDLQFEPSACTASLLLFAQGSTVLCLRHNTLALERRFQKHSKDIQLISTDNVSESGAGRLVVTYDVGRTAIVWDLLTGDQVARFVSYEALTVAHWMRNGNIAFGNAKGEVILFEPATSDHVSARTIFDPITAIAPSSDCKTYAIGYNNGSILLAALQPSFTILHTLTTSRAPSPIMTLTWHASSSKQKSDMLATQTADGDLRVWSVSKPATAEAPRVIRVLKRADNTGPGRNWMAWSKNGRILQFAQENTWAWDVRTKHVTYEPIPTIEGVQGIAAYGPSGTLFTVGPDYTVQQYDVDRAQLVNNVRHMPTTIPPTPPEEPKAPIWTTAETEAPLTSPLVRARQELRATEAAQMNRNKIPSPQTHAPQPSSATSSHRPSQIGSSNNIISPAGRTEYTTTSFDTGLNTRAITQPGSAGYAAYTPKAYDTMSPAARYSAMSANPSSAKPGSRLRQEIALSPQELQVVDLFPFTRARLHDVPYRAPRSADESLMTADDLRVQMLSVVFGWDGDISDLLQDELSRHPPDSQLAILLSRWLDDDQDHMSAIMGITGVMSSLDWMLLALGIMDSHVGAKKITQVFIEKLLSKGDIHAAATLILALGDANDAIEVYVSRNQFMEAVLLTCHAYPDDWQRQSFLVRKWGEHVVENSQQSLAIRCFSCTGVEPSEPWTSPKAQMAVGTVPQATPVQVLPPIYHKTWERRRTIDNPTPVAMPQITNDHIPAPPTPYRTAAAQGTRITPQTSSLKLVTSFGTPVSNPTFRFPGLKPEEKTPTITGSVTPIAESAIEAQRSALSPGGLGSYRLNNMRSINSALSQKVTTPGGYHQNRLPSIGETSAEVETPKSLSAIPPRSISVPAELTSSKGKDDSVLSPVGDDSHPKNNQSLALLSAARYKPQQTPVRETPLTAVAPPTTVKFPASMAALTQNEPLETETRNSSKSRKPDGLSIQTIPVEEMEEQFLPSTSYTDPISRPATTATSITRIESNTDFISPPTTGQSYRSTKSPLVTGRSIDQYISSLQQAQYYEKASRARASSSTSKVSREDFSERRRGRHQDSDDTTDRDGRRPIPSGKRSPSSPVSMSPEDVRLWSTSVESFESMYHSNQSGMERSETPASISRHSRRGSQSTTKGANRQHRSRSRQAGARPKTRSRATSRQPSPDVYQAAASRGRSSSRKEGLRNRSPSSPRPMIPSEEDRAGRQDQGSAMRFVSQDRHRLHRSTSRRPQRDTSARRDLSPDRRRHRARSRSRQPDEAPLSRRSSRSDRNRRQRPNDLSLDQSSTTGNKSEQTVRSMVPPELQEVVQTISNTHYDGDRSKKDAAAEQLEARRNSLTRRPSVPIVPTPGQTLVHNKSASVGTTLPLPRGFTDDSLTTSSGDREMALGDLSGFGRLKERPTTPRAMQITPTVPENEVAPAINGTELLTSEVYRPSTQDGSRPGSARATPSMDFLQQMPKHPAYNRQIANSRSSSKGPEARASSRTRGESRDRMRSSPRDPMTSTPQPAGASIISESAGYTASLGASPPLVPPILPELQHLMAPPPPPPPPAPPKGYLPSPNMSHLRGFQHEMLDGTLPKSAAPTIPDTPGTGNSLNSQNQGHRRGRSGNESSSSQLFGKFRNLTGRTRSPSRGRKMDDNAAMSPRSAVEAMPYESIPGQGLMKNVSPRIGGDAPYETNIGQVKNTSPRVGADAPYETSLGVMKKAVET